MEESAARLKCILDAKYEPADLGWEVEKCTNLNTEEKDKLLKLLEKYKELFDGKLGTWKDMQFE